MQGLYAKYLVPSSQTCHLSSIYWNASCVQWEHFRALHVYLVLQVSEYLTGLH